MFKSVECALGIVIHEELLKLLPAGFCGWEW